MSETPNTVVELPVKASFLKKWSKRTVLTALAVGAVAAIYVKATKPEGETVNS